MSEPEVIPFTMLPLNKDKIYSSIIVSGNCKVYFPMTKKQVPHVEQIKLLLLDYLEPKSQLLA